MMIVRLAARQAFVILHISPVKTIMVIMSGFMPVISIANRLFASMQGVYVLALFWPMYCLVQNGSAVLVSGSVPERNSKTEMVVLWLKQNPGYNFPIL